MLDSVIHWINHYPLDNSIGFASVYPLDNELSGGQRYPSFEQLGPDVFQVNLKYVHVKITVTMVTQSHQIKWQKDV